ncbi:hypothetical protein DKAM_0899 [Desulfurococcus amylolyticus 1221n]|uniref:Uncharacterized protein n=1 Tax=Desulfurococcus amylolyticus (strain DSM 18924 / JCM 16383 / VKM B-2413 / 1221n) TaxID=490899 RepID=B8D544_DESA1|nr:hypothetical protein DKAM_0899 [Desulfurococcus amylolyticus 1221n]
MRGCPGSPQIAPPVNNEARGRGRKRNKGMKQLKISTSDHKYPLDPNPQ